MATPSPLLPLSSCSCRQLEAWRDLRCCKWIVAIFQAFLGCAGNKDSKKWQRQPSEQKAKRQGMRHAVCGMRHAAALCVNNNGTPRRPPPKTPKKKRYKCRWNLLARINQHTHMTRVYAWVCVRVCVCCLTIVLSSWLVLLLAFFYLLSHLSCLEVNQDLCSADKLICDLPSGSSIGICINIICPRLHVNLGKGHKNEPCHAPSFGLKSSTR